jgi:hypothetical protein
MKAAVALAHMKGNAHFGKTIDAVAHDPSVAI